MSWPRDGNPPRQQVNQLCRQLAASLRTPGADHRRAWQGIVNVLSKNDVFYKQDETSDVEESGRITSDTGWKNADVRS